VFELESFYEIPKLLNALNAGKSVVLNVKAMPPEVAQRSVDFVSGFIHGINGHQEQLESGIFMFMPRRDEPLMLAPAAEGGREP
jgi:cell division inhibitor SepF